ncbi:hypothetical protein F2Q70_00031045 [Brassica cretica]|uniref:Uncharacterized protein n=1 Tax=Brassica cretica TaxID=69181 RepID=A0A8S9FNR3_BRACR|nr:hypothetical protein F2Q70_00031045 [Brassica cretica]
MHQHPEDHPDFIYFNLPYLESQALKLQQFFFLQSMHDIRTLQTIKKIHRKLTYPLQPSRYKEDTIYIHVAKILIIKPPTASFHRAINSFEGGYVIVMKSEVQPESHRTFQTGHLGGTSDRGFTEEEVMDFRNWKFPSSSTCEYQLLEVDFSPTMKRPSPE